MHRSTYFARSPCFGKSQLNENYILLKSYHHVTFQEQKRKMISADTSNSTKVHTATMLICGIIFRRRQYLGHIGSNGRMNHELKRVWEDVIVALSSYEPYIYL